ncbi:DUF4913 domain-containing protein [Micromonospora endophytica]|uniref:DUF4913 domain-containing protein n=1 Tax=Micromonospora endophytica TaxID=515350 RepID=A0A2W2CEC2_9ACTN|nr:DUF4913 domain-containing protein [Micromonospora endophytica]PZF91224.1 DUF4913 domain-containing protein [Micromonospora endophytica]RIW51354.1 DUF4913 domain-containing protein [Micromonospora endophytica]
MTQPIEPGEPVLEQSPPEPPPPEPPEATPFFILYLDGPEYGEELRRLSYWVESLLLPVYGGEVTSSSPWCPRWREHPEAIAYLHGLWLAWQERTGPQAQLSDPATWHQSYLWPTMDTLRSGNGPFAGCKPGSHRPKERPPVEPDQLW